MHPRNPYRDPPDFAALADEYQPLKPHVQILAGHSTIDFKDQTSQRCLTKALLYRDFGITLHLPENRLCPPIPNRLNYVLWIQDIIRATPRNPACPVRGIDIGTGASAIYPLLACKLEPKWEISATDVDEISLSSAQSNIDANGLHDQINVVPAAFDGSILLPLYLHPDAMFDFTMCNPPFYRSMEDVAQSAKAKEFEPNAVCTGADVEMITPGGESTFVCRMVRESLEKGTQCRWYTSMLGKMSSLSDVVAQLRQHEIENYGITEFIQGQTRRWAIVWSFDDIHLPEHISRISNSNPTLQSIMPPRNIFRQSFPFPQNQSQPHRSAQLTEVLQTVFTGIDGVSASQQAPIDDSSATVFLQQPWVVYATHNTWSRSARRKIKHNAPVATFAQTPTPICPCPSPESQRLLTCRIGWVEASPLEEDGTILLEAQWVRGRDRLLFESFWNHLSRKAGVALSFLAANSELSK